MTALPATILPAVAVSLLAHLLLYACQQAPAPAGGSPTAWTEGARLYQRLACHGCHSRRGQGGKVGPALDCLGQRLTKDEVALQLQTPRLRQSHSRMPSFAFISEPERQALLHFLFFGQGCPKAMTEPDNSTDQSP